MNFQEELKMSVVHNGKYYSDKKPEPSKSSEGFKRWNHQEQRTAHQADILQRHKMGKPNGEWIRAYPEEAKLSFDNKTIRKYGNNYE